MPAPPATTTAAANALSIDDLVQQLLTNVSHRHLIEAAMHKRLIQYHTTMVADLVRRNGNDDASQADIPWSNERNDNQRTELIPLTKENFPWDWDEEPVLEWMRRIYPRDIAAKVKQSNFSYRGVNNPEEAKEWVNAAIYGEYTWSDCFPKSVRFWKMIRGKWVKEVSNQ
jgi:hypothetical protein